MADLLLAHPWLIAFAIVGYCAAAGLVGRWLDSRADRYPSIEQPESFRDHVGRW